MTDKLFFFGGFQGTRNRSTPPQLIAHVPTAESLRGDFSGLTSGPCQSSGRPLTLFSAGQPFPGNQIPASLLNPIAQKITQSYLPVSAADVCGKVTYGIPSTGDEDQFIGRVDWVQNSKHNLYGRYFVAQYQNPPVFDGKNILTTTAPGNYERAQSLTIGDNYTFGPQLLNAFHFTFNRRRDDRGPTGIEVNPTMLGVNMYSAVPNFLLTAVTGGFSTFCGTCAPGHFNVNAFQITTQFALGTCSRNPVRGPSYQNTDIALIKRTTITERLSIDFRAEAFNLTNTPPLSAPNVVAGAAGFGSITAAGDPRVLQMALKLNF